MADDKKKHHQEREELPPHRSTYKTVQDEITEKEIMDKRKGLFPALSLAMNMMKLSQISAEKEESEEVSSVGENRNLYPERNLLKERLQEKLGELLEEQQALIELYVRAARAAKEKEEEYKEKISELIDQAERDKQLMEMFRNF